MGAVIRTARQLHQAASVRCHGGLAQLQRVHLTQPLEALHVGRATLALELLEDVRLLALVQGVMHFLAQVDAVQRRHGDEDAPGIHQRREVTHEQRAQQRGDVQTIGVGIRQDADLVIAQLGEVVRARVQADGDRDVVDFLGGVDVMRLDFPGIEDLAAQRQDRLGLAVAALLGAAAGGVTLDQKQLTVGRVGA